MFSRELLAKAFKALGLQSSDVVMLHASIKAVGAVAGGADEILYALEDVLSPNGTIMMYVGCDSGFDEVGRGVYPSEIEKDILEKQPSFDYLTARSCRDNGVLAEIFRTQPNTITSQQVGSRMAARGSQAAYLLSDHPHNYSYGIGSPLDKFSQIKGKIVLLGSDHDAVTFLHYVEHIANFSNKIIARYQVPLEIDGVRQWVEMEEFNTASEGVHKNWPDQFFKMIIDSFIKETNAKQGLVGKASTVVIDAVKLLPYANEYMCRVASAE